MVGSVSLSLSSSAVPNLCCASFGSSWSARVSQGLDTDVNSLSICDTKRQLLRGSVVIGEAAVLLASDDIRRLGEDVIWSK